jgi:hypothetical protein
MLSNDIKLHGFYRVKIGSWFTTIVVLKKDKHTMHLSDKAEVCDRWVYWDIGHRVFGWVTSLNKNFLDNMAPIESQSMIQNLRGMLAKTDDEDRTAIIEWLQLKSEAAKSFTQEQKPLVTGPIASYIVPARRASDKIVTKR